jgi:hypothetical protein
MRALTQWTVLILTGAAMLSPTPVAGQEIVVKGSDTVIGLHRDELTVRIEEAIKKGCIWLRDNQARDGSWTPPDDWDDTKSRVHNARFDRRVGATGVILMGLLYSGVNTDSPTIERGLDYISRLNRESYLIYTRGAMCCAYTLADPQRRSKKIGKLVEYQVRWIADMQSKNQYKLWRYSPKGAQLKLFDLSCTQFAIEAYRSADAYGFQMPKAPLAAAQQQLHKQQNQDGGWPYSKDSEAEKHPRQKRSKLSMTAATIGGLAYLDSALTRPREGKARRDPHIDSGLRALIKLYKEECGTVAARGGRKKRPEWTPPTNPYTAYSIERAGILTGTRYLGGHDWYREIAEAMLAVQNEDGSWPTYHGERHVALGTGFTLLFLGKGLAPTIVGKLDWGPPSRATAWDMRNLTEEVSREIGSHLNWIELPVQAEVSEYMKVPLIYITGDESPYDKLMRHKEKFVKYLNAGGTILGAGFDNNKAFEEGFKKFVGEIQPGAAFEELDLDHDIYDRWHKIRRTYGLSATKSDKGGRPVALYIDKPFAIPLGTRRGRGVKRSMELGTNIIVALTQVDKRRNFLGDAMGGGD